MQLIPVLWNRTNCYNNHRESCTEVTGRQVNAMLKKREQRVLDLNYKSKEMKKLLNKKQMLHAVY